MITNGVKVASIIQQIGADYSLNVHYKTINYMRNCCINDIIDTFSDRPYGSSVDKVIALFTATPNVSSLS